jgi:hypothetical protein
MGYPLSCLMEVYEFNTPTINHSKNRIMIQLKKALLFIVLSTVAFSGMSQTFVQEHDITCGDTVYIGNLWPCHFTG